MTVTRPNDRFLKRLEELYTEGIQYRDLRLGQISNEMEPTIVSWLSSSIHLIQQLTIPQSYFYRESLRIINEKNPLQSIPPLTIRRTLGLLDSVKKEYIGGLLQPVEFTIAGATFDEFLDHADTYHKANKKIEASVLASAVFEDTIKKIASKNEITTKSLSIEPLIDELVKANVLQLTKAKRLKGHATVRNSALHAEWNEFDIKDVGELIKATRDLITDHL
jgi:hypothetical protein